MKSSGHPWLKIMGPGILFASTAIGVSHLVQSTKAGAGWGFGLVWAVLIANLLKYPFFEYGSRYASATGTSLIDGYAKMGRWAIWLYLLIACSSMFFVCAAVGKVTSGFLENLFGMPQNGNSLFFTGGLFLICGLLLGIGKFSALDKLIKIIGLVLLASTLTAFVLALIKGPLPKVEGFVETDPWGPAAIAFLIPLMGWMPTAVDLSTWNSLWTVARIKDSGYKPSLNETLSEFNFGYLASVILSLCFVTLGAFFMYGTGQELSSSAAHFAGDVVRLYTRVIGTWSYWIIAASSFSIMFGTCIAVFDGYGRAVERTVNILFLPTKETNERDSKKSKFLDPTDMVYAVALMLLLLGAFLLIWFFEDDSEGFGKLVNVATTVSFLIAPLVAIFNTILVSEKYVNIAFVPPFWMRLLSYLGISYLLGFSFFYLFY